MELAKLVLFGTVTDMQERTGVKDGRSWRIVTAYLVGPRTAYAVTLADDLVPLLRTGENVALEVYGRVYNGRVDYSATGLWDGALSVPAEAGRAAS